MQRLSGVATVTARFVKEVHGTGAEIIDTRKTTPGWRRFEKIMPLPAEVVHALSHWFV